MCWDSVPAPIAAWTLGAGAGRHRVLVICFFLFTGIGGHVLDEFATAFRAFALDHAHTAGGHGAGFEADDAAFADYDLRPEPVGAEHASGGVEGHRGGQRAFKFVAGAGHDALAHLLRPGHAADQRVVEAAALEGHGVAQ